MDDTTKMKSTRWTAVKIAGIFLAASSLWIICSDAIAEQIASTQEMLDTIQTYKGMIYTTIMSFLIYIAVRHSFRQEQKVLNALHESEARLSSVFRAAPVGICIMNGRVYQVCNEYWLKLTGYSSENIIGKDARMFYDTDEEYNRVGRELYSDLEKREITSVETRIRCRDGTYKDIVLTASPLMIANEPASGSVVVVHDVTDRKRAEENQRLTQHSIDNCSTSIIWIRPNGNIAYVNEAACRHLEYSPEELSSMSVSDFDPDWPAEFWPEGWKKLREAGAATFESRHQRKNGEIYPVEITTEHIYFNDEEFLFAFVTDISEQKKAQEALQLTQYAIDNCSTAIYWHRSDGKALYANEAACRQIGYSRDEFLEMSVWDYDPDWPVEFWPQGWDNIKTKKVMTFESRNRHKDGTIFPVQVTTNYFKAGGLEQVFAFITDITQRKQTEKELEQHRVHLEELVQVRTIALEKRTNELEEANVRLREMDQLKSMFIASMSHELRTPLNSIIGFTGIVLKGMSGDLTDKQRDQLGRCYRSAKHLLALITDVIDISKIEAERIDVFPSVFNLKEVVDEAIETIRPAADEKKLQLFAQPGEMPAMKTDRKRLLQCLLNFLSNAVKYSESGEISVSTRDLGKDIEISVSDTGIGIAEKDIAKVFEAFERLDSHLRIPAGGTGLGLHLTRKIAQDLLDGNVSVKSRPGHGSTFTIRLKKHLHSEVETVYSKGLN